MFDVLILAGRNVMAEPLSKRRDFLQRRVLPKLSEPIRESSQLTASLSELKNAVRAHGFEVWWSFTNLPESRSGRWGVGLPSEKMKQCRWLKPALVGQLEYLQWTPDNHLRHARFIALRENKDPKRVGRES